MFISKCAWTSSYLNNQIEEINQTALCEKIVSKISSMNALFPQHIVDAVAEMKRISESVVHQSVEIVHLNYIEDSL